MIQLEVPVNMITFVRSIEGRKFKNGKWEFPDAALPQLQKCGLVSSDFTVQNADSQIFDVSPFLYKYQADIVQKALNAGSYGIFAEMGSGKTIMGLEIASHYIQTLILCPLSVIETAWIDECKRFYPNKKIINCHGNSKQERIDKLNTPADFYVMNYATYKIIKNEIWDKHFDCMIVDESSCMKNLKSQIATMILNMREKITHRFVLSGCPCPNHNSEIFAQMKFVDNEVFGNNYYGFLARYFSQDMSNPHYWFQTEQNKSDYYNRMACKSVFLSKDDCVDLPEQIFEIRQFELSDDSQKHYNNMVQNIKDNINNWSKFEFTAKLMKLREIVSGFVINPDQSITDFKTPKVDVLKEVLDEIGKEPVIVWCQFKHEIEQLAEKFHGVGLTSETKDRDDIFRDFKAGKIKLLFTNPQIAGKGLTFVNCHYAVYYSLSFSYEDFKQSCDRIHRIGQNNKCTYIILQGKDTIDEKIYRCLQSKSNTVNELYLEMGKKQ